MNTSTYHFNAQAAFLHIEAHLRHWSAEVEAKQFVVGISGGKDSAVVAALLARIFGAEHVLGVLLPNGKQSDIRDAREVVERLGIRSLEVNINPCFEALLSELTPRCNISEVCCINLPARLRMATLFAIAQCEPHSFVINTSNLSEDIVGYATQFGDNAGCYAPIQGLTVTEVRALGDWLGLPAHLVHKTPADGLQQSSDEERLGFSYSELDRLIRLNEGSAEFREKVQHLYRINRFKQDIVQMPHPLFPFPNFVASPQN